MATALSEWTPLAEQGRASAQFNLGQLYRRGQGVPQDYTAAVKWFTLAAEQSHAKAQCNLGLMYGYGEGVTLDFAYAYMWWDIAASSGKHKKASKNREIAAKKMSPSQIKKAQGLVRDCIRKKYKGC